MRSIDRKKYEIQQKFINLRRTDDGAKKTKPKSEWDHVQVFR